MMKDIQYAVLVLSVVLLGLLVDEKYDQMVERHMLRSARTNHKPRDPNLYVAKTPWACWTNVTPEGNEVHVTLASAIREGKLQWVVRRDGQYLEDSFEYTTDRELTFEEGLTLIARQETARRSGEKLLVSE